MPLFMIPTIDELKEMQTPALVIGLMAAAHNLADPIMASKHAEQAELLKAYWGELDARIPPRAPKTETPTPEGAGVDPEVVA